MDFFTNALNALPAVASNPLSFVGYALTIGAWVYTYNRSGNLKILMKRIAQIPEVDRKSTVIATLGDPIPAHISAEQWISSKRQQYILTGFIITLLVILIIISVAFYRGAQISAAQAAARARIETCKRQLQGVTDQWNRSKDNLDRRIAALDESIGGWTLEVRRGEVGFVYAPVDQKPLALEIANNAAAKITELEKEKKGVQKKIDALVAAPPVPVKCD